MSQEIQINQINGVVSTIGTPGTDGSIPTEKAVRDAITAIPFTGVVEGVLDGNTFVLGENAIQGDSLFAQSAPEVPPTIDGHGIVYNALGTGHPAANPLGYRVLAKINGFVRRVTKLSTTTATIAEVRSDAGALIASAPFVGDIALFSTPPAIVSGTHYRVMVVNNTATWNFDRNLSNPGYPLVRTNIDYVAAASGTGGVTGTGDSYGVIDIATSITADAPLFGVQALGDINDNRRLSDVQFGSGLPGSSVALAVQKFVNPSATLGLRIETDNNGLPSGSLVSPNAVGSIASSAVATSLSVVNIPLNASITIPRGQRVHIVLFAGNYGSETINATNYYGIGYKPQHSSAFISRRFNGSVRSNGLISPNATGITFNASNVQSVFFGYRIQSKVDSFITQVEKTSTTTATTAEIRDDLNNIVATATFVGNIATFAIPFPIYNGIFYRVGVRSGGSNYTLHRNDTNPSYPLVREHFDYIGGISNVTQNTATYALISITTSASPLFYNVSTALLPAVLSKTDARFPYKLPQEAGRIAAETKNVGEDCVTTTFGLNDKLNGLVPFSDYFISNVPGAISLVPGTFNYRIGKASTANKLYIDGPVLATNGAYQTTAASIGVNSINVINSTSVYISRTTTAIITYAFNSNSLNNTFGRLQVSKDNFFWNDVYVQTHGGTLTRTVLLERGYFYRTQIQNVISNASVSGSVTLDYHL